MCVPQKLTNNLKYYPFTRKHKLNKAKYFSNNLRKFFLKITIISTDKNNLVLGAKKIIIKFNPI